MVQITDWQTILKEPDFWISYYNTHIHCAADEDWQDISARIFGFGPDSVWVSTDVYGYDQDPDGLGEVDSWNTWRIGLPFDYTWSMTFTTTPGSYHELDHPSFKAPILVAWDDPHFRLPFFRWEEIKALAGWFLQRQHVSVDPVYPILALYRLYFFSKGDDLNEIYRVLLPVLTASSLFNDERASELIDCTTHLVQTITPDWHQEPLRWWRDEQAGWVTNGINAYRCCDAVSKKDPQEWAAVKRFLEAVSTLTNGDRL